MAYDAQSDRIILFGGRSGSQSDGETWSFDANHDAWVNLNPASHPPARSGHAIAYDARADRMILFGGSSCRTPVVWFGDTWSYDYETNAWLNLTTASGPSPRVNHAMAYDNESDTIVLFGGSTASSIMNNETWTYDFTTNTWTRVVQSPAPAWRYSQAMAYDAQSDRIVMFGGVNGRDQTWEYNVNTNAWVDVSRSGGPTGAVGAAIAYDSRADRVVLFGGEHPGPTNAQVETRETWEFDVESSVWANVTPDTGPSARSFHGIAYDSESAALLLFGGENAQRVVNGETWIRGTSSGLPPAPGAPPWVIISIVIVGVAAVAGGGYLLWSRRPREPRDGSGET